MKQCGIVTEVNGDLAKVVMERHSSCGSCTACKMGREESKLEIEAINVAKAQKGQWVSVDMEHQDVLTAALIVYVIPLISLVLGIFIGNILVPDTLQYKDIAVAAIGFVLMALSFLVIKSKEGKIKASKKYQPVITAAFDERQEV
ncbi:SoxR reducing system RseC family protein [Alkaliphilus peptidifermentans]|uniref:Positive regulator of sigma(E), RseC/MucC n=1 Tax=Alkaliphilus peptidifermentans DSM 18978 TaxID=1120976 RepID=A0A1G5L3J7_9FIRM|nr:SoxR reducing system RseC family protein [Alkaliphilus peptidifermentans]SCZ07144.1 positive regulator of sigma(E), RseC/MucC [Alkaliphilus peptidifermentans DSM 18978]